MGVVAWLEDRFGPAGPLLAGALAGGVVLLAVRAAQAAAYGFPTPPGFCATVYPVDRTEGFLPYLERIQPQIVQLHSGIDTSPTWAATVAATAARARAVVPGARVWVGLGVDGAVRLGPGPALETARRLVDATQAEALVWNAERAFHLDAPRGAQMAQALLAAWKSERPGTPQGHTAYAQPLLKPEYPWSAWLGGRDAWGSYELAADFTLPQIYDMADERREPLDPGVYAAFAAASARGWEQAVAAGVVSGRVPRGIYAPAAFVPPEELLAACTPYPVAAFWPWAGGYDDAGLAVARALADRWR